MFGERVILIHYADVMREYQSYGLLNEEMFHTLMKILRTARFLRAYLHTRSSIAQLLLTPTEAQLGTWLFTFHHS